MDTKFTPTNNAEQKQFSESELSSTAKVWMTSYSVRSKDGSTVVVQARDAAHAIRVARALYE
jgi:hypothetical protein